MEPLNNRNIPTEFHKMDTVHIYNDIHKLVIFLEIFVNQT